VDLFAGSLDNKMCIAFLLSCDATNMFCGFVMCGMEKRSLELGIRGSLI
jgi:hypothetical protein